MATNTGNGHRRGSVNDRTQFQLPSGHFAKRDTTTGQILDVKTSSTEPFKGIAQETDGRRS